VVRKSFDFSSIVGQRYWKLPPPPPHVPEAWYVILRSAIAMISPVLLGRDIGN
jgi:hypothetical protein